MDFWFTPPNTPLQTKSIFIPSIFLSLVKVSIVKAWIKNASNLLCSITRLELCCLLLYMISFEMILDINMLTCSMLYLIFDKFSGRFVVHIFNRGFFLWLTKFF